MGELLAIITMVVFVGGCLSVGFWLWKRSFMQVEQQWLQIAADLNWDIMISPNNLRWLKRQYPAMKGSLNGLSVACIMSPTGGGYTTAKTTVVVSLQNPTNYEMTLIPTGIVTEEASFDQCFRIESTQKKLEQNLFTPVVQQLLLDRGRLLKGNLTLENEQLSYQTTVQVNTDKLRQYFIEILELITKLADYIQNLKTI